MPGRSGAMPGFESGTLVSGRCSGKRRSSDCDSRRCLAETRQRDMTQKERQPCWVDPAGPGSQNNTPVWGGSRKKRGQNYPVRPCGWMNQSFFFFFFSFSLFFFLQPHLRHMEIPRFRESNWSCSWGPHHSHSNANLSLVFDLHHSSRQHLNSLSEAKGLNPHPHGYDVRFLTTETQ